MMKRLLMAVAAGLVLIAGLAGCASQSISDYADKQPVLDLERYFVGQTQAWGMFQKRGGEVARRFTVTINGRMEDGKLILDEDFTYDDGEKDRRVWVLSRREDGRWEGTAGDVVGTAVGDLAGNAFHWRYTLALPVDDTVYNVNLDDWMYLIDERTLINRASMSKFGFEVGQITLFFKKVL